MSVALAENERTQRKAAIKRASTAGRRDMRRLDREAVDELTALYRGARSDLESRIAAYAGRDDTIRLEALQELLGEVQSRLDALSAARDGLLEERMADAAEMGVRPFESEAALTGSAMPRVADDALRFVRTFVAEDGLQLSDRLWRLDAGAREGITRAVESAVIQGHSATQAAAEFIARGEAVPAAVAGKVSAAAGGTIAAAAGWALMVDEGNAYDQALRVFRTEINRAHGEAYRAAAAETEDAAGTRFLLSPNHPRPDICDMHASVNRYGLGAGVYPFGKSPWPAHPNTLSFEEIVFADEISDDDRAGKEDRIAWLKRQSPGIQEGVLGSRMKRGALQQGMLSEGEIATPWRVLRKRYERRGIAVESLKPAPIMAPVEANTRTSRRESVEYVRKQGLETGWEFASIHDRATGELLFRRTSRSPNHVQFTNGQVAVLDDPVRRIDLVHNHPSSGSLSEADMRVSTLAGIESIIAVGHNGSVFVGRGLTTSARLGRAYNEADVALRRRLDPRVDAGDITLDDAGQLWNHLKHEVLARRGFVRYRIERLTDGPLRTAMDKVGPEWLERTVEESVEDIDWENL